MSTPPDWEEAASSTDSNSAGGDIMGGIRGSQGLKVPVVAGGVDVVAALEARVRDLVLLSVLCCGGCR